MFNSIMKTIHFAHLVIFIYGVAMTSNKTHVFQSQLERGCGGYDIYQDARVLGST